LSHTLFGPGTTWQDRLVDDETCHATSLSWKYDVTQVAHSGGMSFGSNLGPTSGSDFGL